MMIFHQVENILSTYEPHACMVVYSIVDRCIALYNIHVVIYLHLYACISNYFA
jgi:hypothetical protein